MSHETRYHTLSEREFQAIQSRLRDLQSARASLQTQLESERQKQDARVQRAVNETQAKLRKEITEQELRNKKQREQDEIKRKQEMEKLRKENATQVDRIKARLDIEHQFVEQRLTELRSQFTKEMSRISARIDQLSQEIQNREKTQIQIVDSLILEAQAMLQEVESSGMRQQFEQELINRLRNEIAEAERFREIAPQTAISYASSAMRIASTLKPSVERDERLWFTYQDHINAEFANVQSQIASLQQLQITVQDRPIEDQDDRVGSELVDYWTHGAYSATIEEWNAVREAVDADNFMERSIEEQQELLNRIISFSERFHTFEDITYDGVGRYVYMRSIQDRIEEALLPLGWEQIYDDDVTLQYGEQAHADNGIVLKYKDPTGRELRIEIGVDGAILSDLYNLPETISPDIRQEMVQSITHQISGAIECSPTQTECVREYETEEPDSNMMDNVTRINRVRR